METVVEARNALLAGRLVLIRDDDKCVVAASAESVDEQLVTLAALRAGGVICVAVADHRFEELGLQLQVSPVANLPDETREFGALGVSVDWLEGTSTGISARDRMLTIKALGTLRGPTRKLGSPGHVFPVRVSGGGTLDRLGLAEAAADLARSADIAPVVMICVVLNDHGELASPEAARAMPEFAEVPMVSVRDVRDERLRSEQGVSAHEVDALFRETMSALPAGLAVITARTPEGEPKGLAVSALSSFSATPPSIVVSVSRTSRSHAAVTESSYFGVHLLHADQVKTAECFASSADDKFDRVSWSWDEDVPHLQDALAYLRCKRIADARVADHSLVIGAIVGGTVNDGNPLLYFRRSLEWTLEPRAA